MSEWHVTPDYIVNNWTDEFFDLMVEKLVERKRRESDAIKGTSSPDNLRGKETISDTALFSRMGNNVKVVKKHGD